MRRTIVVLVAAAAISALTFLAVQAVSSPAPAISYGITSAFTTVPYSVSHPVHHHLTNSVNLLGGLPGFLGDFVLFGGIVAVVVVGRRLLARKRLGATAATAPRPR